MSKAADSAFRVLLAEFEAKRAMLDQAIALLKQAHGVEIPAVRSSAPILREGASNYAHLDIPEAIEAYLRHIDQPQRVQDIADSLKQGGLRCKYHAVYGTLKQLRFRGLFQKVGMRWGLAEWSKRKKV